MTRIPAIFNGLQDSLRPGVASFELWTILEPCEGHPMHSTLSINTLHALGFHPYQPEEDV